jgi:hypothetical protein
MMERTAMPENSPKCHLPVLMSRLIPAVLVMATGLILLAPPLAAAVGPSVQAPGAALVVLKGQMSLQEGDSEAPLAVGNTGIQKKGPAPSENRILGGASRLLRMAGRHLVFNMFDIQWKPKTRNLRRVVFDLSAGPGTRSWDGVQRPAAVFTDFDTVPRFETDRPTDFAGRIRQTRVMIRLTIRY